MAGKRSPKQAQPAKPAPPSSRTTRPSALLDTRIIYCGDCVDQLAKLPDGCVDRLYLWHRFPTGDSNSNRNYEVFWGEAKEKRAFEDRHASTQAYIDYMRPRCPTVRWAKWSRPWPTCTAAIPAGRSGDSP